VNHFAESRVRDAGARFNHAGEREVVGHELRGVEQVEEQRNRVAEKRVSRVATEKRVVEEQVLFLGGVEGGARVRGGPTRREHGNNAGVQNDVVAEPMRRRNHSVELSPDIDVLVERRGS